MVKLITPDRISFRATVSEEELRNRLAYEVLQQIGALDADGKRKLGITVAVKRGESRKGGYSIEVTGPAPVQMFPQLSDRSVR